MDMVDVEVHIVPKFGLPDFSLTGTQIGRRLRSAGFRGRPGDVWEVVRLVNGKTTLPRSDVGQKGRCRFVQALFIRVNFALEYFIASELQNNISDATDPTVKRVHRAILQRIIQQAKHHYEDYVDVITE